MPEYTENGINNYEMKILMNIYLDSLEVELVTLKNQLAREFSRCPELLESLNRSHDSFMQESYDWAYLSEERMWWNTKSAERFDGTARGYEFTYTPGMSYWQRICRYSRMIHYGESHTENSDMEPATIGGYCP